jgi:hypothetical protein
MTTQLNAVGVLRKELEDLNARHAVAEAAYQKAVEKTRRARDEEQRAENEPRRLLADIDRHHDALEALGFPVAVVKE